LVLAALVPAVLVALLAACTGELGDPESALPDASAPRPTPDASPCPEASILAYDNFGGPFMSQYCTGCHGSAVPEAMRQEAPLGVDFDTLDLIRMQAERIYVRAADEDTMPPGGGPHPDDRRLLAEWLLCGAP